MKWAGQGEKTSQTWLPCLLRFIIPGILHCIALQNVFYHIHEVAFSRSALEFDQ